MNPDHSFTSQTSLRKHVVFPRLRAARIVSDMQYVWQWKDLFLVPFIILGTEWSLSSSYTIIYTVSSNSSWGDSLCRTEEMQEARKAAWRSRGHGFACWCVVFQRGHGVRLTGLIFLPLASHVSLGKLLCLCEPHILSSPTWRILVLPSGIWIWRVTCGTEPMSLKSQTIPNIVGFGLDKMWVKNKQTWAMSRLSYMLVCGLDLVT